MHIQIFFTPTYFLKRSSFVIEVVAEVELLNRFPCSAGCSANAYTLSDISLQSFPLCCDNFSINDCMKE